MSGKDWKKQRRFRQAFARQLQKMLHKPLLMPPYNGPLHSIAILAQEKYGDAILLTPLLRQLSIHFPKTEVHLITFSQATHDFFRNDRNIDALHFAKGNTIAYYRRILSRRFDLLFNTKDHPSTSFLLQSLIIRARRKAGIDCPYHRGIYDYLVDLDFHTQVALKNCALLALLGKPVKSDDCRPYIPEKPLSETVRTFLHSLPERHYIGINISAGGATRYWTEENWKRLSENFTDDKFVLFSAPGDHEQKERLERSCPNIIPSPATRNLYEVSMIAARLKLLITPDTAMVHVASCVNTPVIGLYGIAPQDQSRFMPFMVKHRIIVSSTAFVRDISPDQAVKTCQEMLRK
ncbi:MAG: lipopolysaccharide heptosyltransferase family protein [Chlorobium sp.]|uniref:glycosyltransferase family 9 protein n=1 Tax=Chlorobium sp. TaxID=1095 RepID=UPI0025BCCCB2|nr:glycosyltransferase family 9 protein [Chlorobium sp.]MCF8216975.1 lipopolysaccharide heptosyltransferase family protein [Chlorobium sp.]MCF8271805.1 lipopolysaccharide heptosyltransferase family protein [Chlorobium sp.]MCF8288192.1 lipopolysaccharide heptosyltransferase family protein [Chlorobium sp.]MCF8291555.1 lipopolysaccharide heptosyltransferase family protein [Chlorobium sp.]MCF8385875.1 lipopolysaccharide heptosyltransferase family protein [Chlorobium sp.]